MNLAKIAVDKGNQVFHSKTWSMTISEDLILELLEEARKNSGRKSRLCLHPNPEEIMQVTYLAFVQPYEDRIHKHPNRAEVLVPLKGKAEFRTFDENGNILRSNQMLGGSGLSFSTESGEWHSLKVLTPEFIMIEIGKGPFAPGSTQFVDH